MLRHSRRVAFQVLVKLSWGYLAQSVPGTGGSRPEGPPAQKRKEREKRDGKEMAAGLKDTTAAVI